MAKGVQYVQVKLEPEQANRLSVLAERMGVSRQAMHSMLLDAALQDNEWIINLVTSRVAQVLRGGRKGPGRGKRRGSSAASSSR